MIVSVVAITFAVVGLAVYNHRRKQKHNGTYNYVSVIVCNIYIYMYNVVSTVSDDRKMMNIRSAVDLHRIIMK